MKWSLNQFAALPAPVKFHRRLAVWLAISIALAAGLTAWAVKRRANREFDAARAALERQAFVPFDKELRRPLTQMGVTLLQSRRQVRGLARFNDALFAATDGGLVELAEDGTLKRQFTTLDGLPESDLTVAAAFASKLYIGSRSQGLIAFDGKRFERYRWPDRKAQAVTTLTETPGRLLVGTFAGGLLEFDGSKFKEIEPNEQRLTGINCVVADNTRLLIGTFADGLWINEAGHWTQFTIADGLPSNRVVGLAPDGDRLLVATDFGVALMAAGASSPKRFQTLATLPSLAGIWADGNTILLGKDNGEVFQLAIDAGAGRAQLNPLPWKRAGNLSSCQLKAFKSKTGQTSEQRPEQALWLLSSEGLWRTSWRDERFPGRLNFTAFGDLNDANQLSSNVVSATAIDGAGRLWIGSFRNGIDVFTREGRRIAHIETEAVREINSLVWDEASKRMLTGTAQGLVQFNDGFQSVAITKADGLLANSVSHAAPLGSRIALATSRGLTLGESKRWQALTTVQGLPSNSVYSLLPHREFLFAGTLGGLAQIAGGRVIRVFKDSNSKLSQNWVTALCSTGNRIFVGTYGGGVFELTPAGEFTDFKSEIGKQTVNPNAMFCDGEWLYAGTLDGAWAMNLNTQQWIHLRDELPSRTVMSVTGDGERIYFGTTNGIARVDKNDLKFVKE